MQTPYITVTLEVSGYDDEVMADFHAHMRDILDEWRKLMAYAELRIAYQDQEQISEDATFEPAPDSWDK